MTRMKTPTPDHPITVAPATGRVRVRFAGRTVAETDRAQVLQEASYPKVYYVPREHADMTLLERSARSTHCPYKGDAAYYSLCAGDRHAPDAVWTYESPYPAVAAIKGHLAFYPDRVDAIEELPG
jgi:uncharacterized protein (DUF427 family)